MKITALPKVELHRHLELCVRPSTIRELAPQFGMALKSEQDFASRFLIQEPMKDLGTVLQKFLDTQKLWASPELIERLTFEACEDAFRIDNVRLLEMRYAPTFIQMNHKINFIDIHEAILRGVRRAEKIYPMAIGLICIIQRILPVAEAEAVTDFAIQNRETFVGLDLADNEVGFDSKPFASFFKKAKASGLGITVHSGEADVPKAPRYVRDAIDYLGATRIGHGVQIYRDPEMISYVKERQVTLELCPTSNFLTQAVAKVENHPFRQLMGQGVRTTINTDDPGIFGIDLNHEYELLEKHHRFSKSDFDQCNQFAYEASFVPEAKKRQVWPPAKS